MHDAGDILGHGQTVLGPKLNLRELFPDQLIAKRDLEARQNLEGRHKVIA
jgi:hypothetical protein